MNNWLRVAGLRRHQIWTGNVYEYQAPMSNITLAPKDEVEAWADTIHARLPSDPWVIVPFGGIALRALLRKPLWSLASPKIGDWRGSILKYEWAEGGWCKLIPTYHPAASFRDPSIIPLCLADWKRIAEESRTRERRLPKRVTLTPPHSPAELNRYLKYADDPDTIMAFDIETNPKARQILCIGFSYRPDEALVVQWPVGTAFAKRMLAGRSQKAGQLAYAYDRFWLANEGVHVTNYVWDLIGMHHALFPTLPHDLGTMASVDTRTPFWKRSHKDSDSATAHHEPIDRLMIYCGYDCMGERELVDAYRSKLIMEPLMNRIHTHTPHVHRG